MTRKTLPKPAGSNKQVREYIEAVEKGYNSLFIVPTEAGWSVRHSSTGKIQQTYSTKTAAIQGAKKIATAPRTEIFVFDEAGQLLARQ
jgi:hypothetical protein